MFDLQTVPNSLRTCLSLHVDGVRCQDGIRMFPVSNVSDIAEQLYKEDCITVLAMRGGM